MEFLIGAVVVVILLLCLGVDMIVIASWVMGLIGLGIVVLAVFFIVCAAAVICSERVTAVFSELKAGKGSFDVAYYIIDGEEYPNLFPGEFVMRDKFYHKDKPVRIKLLRKAGVVFDKNALLTIYVGLAVCVPIGILVLICAPVFLGIG